MSLRDSIKDRYHRAKAFIERNERRISSSALLLGFVIDSITLRRVDLLAENGVLVGYILIASVGILLLNLIEAGRIPKERFKTLHALSLIGLQFAFGGLASAFLVFYSRSASFVSSWPFLLLLIAYLVGNEVLKKRYVRLNFQMAIYFLSLNSYLIFLMPVLLKQMGDAIFVLSGIAALLLISLFIFLLSRLIPEIIQKSKRDLALIVAGMFALIQIFYFTNLIPPIPLALKDSGIYHSVTRLSGGTYELVGESATPRFLSFLFPQETVHYVPGETLYAWSPVFAPTDLRTRIFHSWQRYDEARDGWVTEERIELPISGGRAGGFRTFSAKSDLSPGKWRVNVETPRGQLIGRIRFMAEEVATVPSQQTYVR